jgi:hypothetical protein
VLSSRFGPITLVSSDGQDALKKTIPTGAARSLTRALCSYAPALLLAAAFCLAPTAAQSRQPKGVAAAQKGAAAQAPRPEPALRRASVRREVRRFGFGNTLAVHGAPAGSITIEAWPRAEIEIEAEIELRADTEEELARLAAVNNFVLDEDSTRVTLMTTGTHDRKFMQRAAKRLPEAKDFPKRLLSMPWKIDYRIRVPQVVDLEVAAGSGALVLQGVEGSLQLSAGESRAALTLSGGDVSAMLAGGSVLLRVAAESWRGRGLTLRLVSGDLTVALPAGFNGEVTATILRAGRIENAEAVFSASERASSSGRSLRARAGAGGTPFLFEVGDGRIRFERLGGEKARQ